MAVKSLRNLWLSTLVTLTFVLGVAGASNAQQSSNEATITATSPSLAEALRLAQEAGISVIIVDSSGAVKAPDNPAAIESVDDDGDVKGTRLMGIQMRAQGIGKMIRQQMADMPAALNEVVYVLKASSPTGYISEYVYVLVFTLLLFVVGALVERFVYGPYFAGPYFVLPLMKDEPQGFTDKLPFLASRFIAGFIGVFIGIGVAFIIGRLIFGETDDTAIEFTITVIFSAYFLSRSVALLWRMILSPFLSRYRLSRFDDREALVLYRWLWRIAVLDVCVQMFAIWLFELGLNQQVYGLFLAAGVLLSTTVSIAMILFNRKAISHVFSGGRTGMQVSFLTRLFAALWAPVAIVYLLFAWIRLTVDLVSGQERVVPLLAGAYAVLLSSIVAYALFNFFIERMFARSNRLRRIVAERNTQAAAEAKASESLQAGEEMTEELSLKLMAASESGDSDGDGDEEGGGGVVTHSPAPPIMREKHPLCTYEDLAKRVSGVLALTVGLAVSLAVWDVAARIMAIPIVETLFDFFVAGLIGYIAFHAFRIWIDKKIDDETPDMEEAELGDEGGAGSASRLGTLLPLFRGFILTIIVITIILTILLEMGVNVSPLFAGAGVVGIAIGFGSQALVRDIFSGAFFLFDDAFRRGEYIDIGEVKGTVESISVRSFQLRHHLGALHTVPFGEIQHITNFSRDWVIMKLPLRVTYDTNVERVRKLIKNLGISLLDDEEIGDQFIQPLKSQGVIEMQDSAMIIRVKFMTKPGDQWIIRKRVYQEIRDLFEREGVKFAHREVTVRLADADAKNLSEEDKKIVAAAALENADEQAPKAAMDDR